MDHRIHFHNQFSMPVPPVKKQPVTGQAKTDFKQVLEDTQRLKISKHAKERMGQRNIMVNDNTWDTISKKVRDAREKGVTDSLVLTPNAALLVSTNNNTVITAMDRSEATSKVFTNIDGAIVINE